MATSKITSKRSILWSGNSNTKDTDITVTLNGSYTGYSNLALIFSDVSSSTNVIAESVVPVSALAESTPTGVRTTAFGATHYYVQLNRVSDTSLQIRSGQLTALAGYNLYLKRIEGFN